jgi:Ca2+-binding RTX toxin-like protein
LERTVLDLSLGTVVVRDVQVNPEGGYKLTLSFGQMSLETWGNVPVGANTGLLQTQWNLETETNVLTGPILAAPGGTLGNDVLAGSAAADTLDGGAGNDALYGLAGNDALNGSNGADTLVGGAGNDVLAGGLGTGDYASYVGATGGVTVSLSVTTSQNTGGAGSDRLSGIEGLIGSGLGDTLTGDSLTNVIYGGDGIDQIIGLGGNDVLFGDAGNDSLLGGSGSDTISGGAGNDLFIFNATNEGVDVITDFDSSSTPGDTDGLRFAAAAFGGLPVGAILGTQFQSGPLPHALTSDVRFIYSTAAFGLFYDADGSGALFSPILLAQITTPILAGDIQII